MASLGSGFRAATAANAMGRAVEVRSSQTPLILDKGKYKAPLLRQLLMFIRIWPVRVGLRW